MKENYEAGKISINDFILNLRDYDYSQRKIMSDDRYDEFLKDLDHIQEELKIYGIDYYIMQAVFALKNKVKDFFPMNGVPENIVDHLNVLQNKMEAADLQMKVACKVIMMEVEKMKKEVFPNG